MTHILNPKLKKAGLSTLVACLLLFGACTYEVKSPPRWSDTVRLQRHRVTDSLTVWDEESQWVLFTYYDPPLAQPIAIEKMDQDHWITVFERPLSKTGTKIKIEKVGLREYLVKIED